MVGVDVIELVLVVIMASFGRHEVVRVALRPLAPLRNLAVANGEPPWAALPPPMQGARCRR